MDAEFEMDEFKQKIYLDTSIINHIVNKQDPTLYSIANLVINKIKDKYNLVCSTLVIEEISRTKSEQLRNEYINKISELNIKVIDAMLYKDNKIINELLLRGLSLKSITDATHICCAFKYVCNYILSDNLRHFLNKKVREYIKEISNNNCIIYTAEQFLQEVLNG